MATKRSDHDEPVIPDGSSDRRIDGRNRLRVADLTSIANLGGFAYLAAIIDARSRRVLGYAIGRWIDARLTRAARAPAIERYFPDVSGTRQRRKEPATLRSPKSSTLYETVASQTKKTRELPCPHLNLHILSHTLFMPLRCTTARSSVISCVVRSDCSTSSH